MKKLLSVLITISLTLSFIGFGFDTKVNYSKQNSVAVAAEETIYPQIELSFTPLDSVKDPNRSIIYLTDRINKRLYSVNYETGNITFIQLSMLPGRMCIYNNLLYVALSIKEHDAYWDLSVQSGAIAIFDTVLFKLNEQFNVSMDPYDIALTEDNIFITNGSGQSGYVECYSKETKLKINGFVNYTKSLIKYNPSINTIYTSQYGYYETISMNGRSANPSEFSSVLSYMSFRYKNGKERFEISPDGKYIFNFSGPVFECSETASQRISISNSLYMIYNAIDFSDDDFFIANDTSVIRYAYKDFSQISSANFTGKITDIFYLTPKDKIVTLYYVTSNSTNKYYIKTINPPSKSHQMVTDKISGLNSPITVTDYQSVNDIRILYDKLPIAEKEFVTNYAKLLSSESDLDSIFNSQKLNLVSLIDSLPEQITVDDRDDIKDAFRIYETLPPLFKNNVTNYSKLKSAIDSISNSITFPNVTIPFTSNDSVMDHDNYKVYLTDTEGRRVYCVNLITGTLTYIQFTLMPGKLYLYNNSLYVTLSGKDHYMLWGNVAQCGAIGIIDTEMFTLSEQFNININPYDIAVYDGYIYISSGSGDSGLIMSYSLESHNFVNSFRSDELGNILINEKTKRLCLLSIKNPKGWVRMYTINSGVLTENSSATDYTPGNSTNIVSGIAISEDNELLFKHEGIIFKFKESINNYTTTAGTLDMPYIDIAFDSANGCFYTTTSQDVRKYDISNFMVESHVNSPGNMKRLFYNNKLQKLVGIYSGFQSSGTTTYLSYINPLKDAEFVFMDDVNNLPENITLSHKQTIIDLRANYENMLPDQKAAVTNYEKLTIAESKLSRLIDNSIFEFDEETGTIISYNGTATSVVIPPYINGVQVSTIGSSAFARNATLKSVSIPSTITELEEMAFYMCTAIDSIKFPYNMTTIGSLSFAGCISLKIVNLPDSIVSTGFGIFLGSSITSPVFVGDGEILIYVPGNLTAYTVPSGVKRIEGMTFFYQTTLRTIVLPESLTEIGYQAFGTCSSLDKINIPSSVTTIEEGAFENCTAITELAVSKNLDTIGDYVFWGCDNLVLTGDYDSNACLYALDYGIPFVVNIDSNYDFDVTNATIVKYKGTETAVVVPLQFLEISVKKIGMNAFYSNESLQSVTIQEPVEEIGISAFYNCTNLTTVNLPNSLKIIKSSAFSSCANLVKFDLPLSVNEINLDVFANTPYYNTLTDEFVCVGNGILIKYNGSATKVIIPGYVKIIGGLAFTEKTSIESITMPNSIERICDYGFFMLTNVKSVIFSNSLTSIGAYAFSDCRVLPQIYLPSGVKLIGSGAFSYCVALTNLVIPDSVTEIGDNAFEWSYNLTSITLSKNITELNSNLFKNATNLKGIEIPQSVQSIKEDTFANSSINKITVLNEDMLFPDNNIFYKPNSNSTAYEDYIYTPNVVICGVKGSTAQKYCEYLSEFGYKFEVYSYYANMIFNSMGGSAVSTKSILKGNTVSSPANPIRSGYIFAGWFTSTAYTTPWTFATNKVTANTTLYAKWIATQVTGLKVASAGYNSLKLTWTATTGANYYEIYRASTLTGTYYLVTTIAATSAPSYTNAALGTGTTYYYKVRAYSLNGTTKTYNNYSVAASAKPIPATPTGLVATAASYNSTKLSWTAVTGASGYSVYRATSSSGTYSLLATVTTNTYTKTALTTGATYYYRVNAYRLVGTTKVYGSQSGVVAAKVVPSTPVSLAASSPSYNSIRLTWGAVYGANGYSVYRSPSTTGTYTLIATVTTNSYSNINLATGTTYYYKVNAYRLVGATKVYGSQCAAVGKKVVPPTISTLTAVRYSATSNKLSWGAISGASGYEIYRSTSSSGTYTLLTTLTAISYINTSLVTGTTYYYKVRAYRLVGTTKVYADFSAVKYAKP